MKYTDRHGDTWEELTSQSGVAELECTESDTAGFAGTVLPKLEVETDWGPLTPVPEPSECAARADEDKAAGPTVSDVMSRASVFQAAHAMVSGLKWGDDDAPSIYDVLQVAKWMGESE
ncbi:hypothetical protein [Streptomyces sp. R44]|uniref:Uncharacterized protein n=1 Tax=Streptomyces sp. R44 TaxID=3238633 RepID=A0AB39T4Z6_9ACTN